MKREAIILFVIFSLLSIPNLVNICRHYVTLTYDFQILLAWDYSASIGLLPYKDFYYPYYGLLKYFRGENVIASAIYYCLAPCLCTCLYLTFEKLFKDRLVSYTSIFAILLFVYFITGFETFSRYGILVAFACFYAYLFYSYKLNISKVKCFFTGILIGTTFAFFNDQGIYALLLFIAMFIIDIILRRRVRISTAATYLTPFVECAAIVCGVVVGVVPFLIYLIATESLYPFITSLSELSDIQLFAKTPFIHSLITSDNIFTLGILLIVLSYLSYKLIYKEARASFATYVLIGLSVVLIILEQKNIVRSTDTQLTFIAFVLFIVLFCESKKVLEVYNISRVKLFSYYIVVLFTIVFVIGLHPHDFIKNVTWCQRDSRFEVNTKKYQELKNAVKEISGFDNKIFSFPGDTALYVMFKQKMPYYPTIYETASVEAQNRTIKYIEDNNIKYVIYNYKYVAIQDEVPNYTRAIIHRYILNNYSIREIVGEFLIMERNENEEDFFKNRAVASLPEFESYLLDINLENIPRTEGFYKKDELLSKDSKNLISSNSLKKVNEYLNNNMINSTNKFMAVELDKGVPKQKSAITIKTGDGQETSIRFNQCESGVVCIIDLSNIPLFYKARQIKAMSVNDGDKLTNISLYDISGNTMLW